MSGNGKVQGRRTQYRKYRVPELIPPESNDTSFNDDEPETIETTLSTDARPGQPTLYEERYVNMAYKACKWYGMGLEQLAALFSISIQTIYNWRANHVEFFEAIKQGNFDFDTVKIVQSLKSRAMGYEYDEVKIEEIINVKELAYGRDWAEELKDAIKERDDYTCKNPKCKTDFHSKTKKQKELDIHHIDFFKSNNHPENLITLCKTCHGQCHGKGNTSQQRWKKYYELIIKNQNSSVSINRLVPIVKRTITTKKIAPSVTAQMFWLQNRQRDDWKNVSGETSLIIKGEFNHTGKVDHNHIHKIDPDKLTKAEHESLRSIVQNAFNGRATSTEPADAR